MFYWVVKAMLWPLLRIFRPWAEGTENVPREGPAIIASNHLSFSDHFFAPLPLPRKVVFLAKSEYFTGRGLKGLVSKAFEATAGEVLRLREKDHLARQRQRGKEVIRERQVVAGDDGGPLPGDIVDAVGPRPEHDPQERPEYRLDHPVEHAHTSNQSNQAAARENVPARSQECRERVSRASTA